MTKKVVYVFVTILLCFIGLLVFVGSTFSVKKETKRTDIAFVEIAEWTKRSVQAGEEGYAEATVIYEVPLVDEVWGRDNLVIFTAHQNMQVYIGEEEVYTLQWEEGRNAFGKSPGLHWNFISIAEKDAGKTAKVLITSPYEASLKFEPIFYIGDKEAICNEIIKSDLLPYLVSFLLLLVGVVLTAFWLYAYRDLKKSINLLYIGSFAIILGIWLGNELHSTQLILGSPIICSYVSFMSLMLLPIPFLLYAQDMFSDKKDKSWVFLCGLSVLQIVCSVVLQVLNIKDFKETLFLVHGILGIIFAWIIYHIVKEIRREGLSEKLKMNLTGISFCAVGAVMDVVGYYLASGRTAQIGCAAVVLAYIVVLGVKAVRETYHMLQQGRMAKKYEEMAYHDQMTGLYNRAAYEEMVSDPVVKNSFSAIVMFDLNDLKKCNDVCGHEAGDSYIIRSARIISESFDQIGTCYRIGGDEFCAIVPEEKISYCRNALEKLEQKIAEENAKKTEAEIHIAYGYAVFDKELDRELSDTRSRADANMYHMKFAMKEAAKNGK